MTAERDSRPFSLAGAGGGTLAGEEIGSGAPIVLLHGLTATRRYVVQGSTLLARGGRRLIAYDARGHGESDPAPYPTAYEYADLVADLRLVLEERGLERAVLVGSSMGAVTALPFALAEPERVAALVLVTPAYAGVPRSDSAELVVWDARAEALGRGDLAEFVERTGVAELPDRFREPARVATLQRVQRHRHPAAVADALRVVPRSRSFNSLADLGGLAAPTLVVGSRDDADPGHPLAVAEDYAARIPGARLAVEEPGKAPLAWQGSQLSREIAGFLERAQA